MPTGRFLEILFRLSDFPKGKIKRNSFYLLSNFEVVQILRLLKAIKFCLQFLNATIFKKREQK